MSKIEYHDADPASINGTIREKNRDEDIILRDLKFLFDPEKYHYESKKTASSFNNNYYYIEYESIGDKDKILTIKEYLYVITPSLSNVINNHKTKYEWKIYLTILINFISSKYSDETSIMHATSDNIEFMMGSETDEIIEELLKSPLERYQELLEESVKGSESIFDSVIVLY